MNGSSPSGRAIALRKMRDEKEAFTLIELLVVISIIAILAAMLLPALGRAQTRSRGIGCLANTKQLQLAWYLYATDANDRLVPNQSWELDRNNWVALNYGQANSKWGCTNQNSVREGLLWKYVQANSLYVCPDQKVVFAGTPYGDPLNGGTFPGKVYNYPPARSFSISQRMNGYYGEILTLSAIKAPPPAKAFVFIDENLYTIDDGIFAVWSGYANTWINVPAGRHGNTGTLSFADGHSESHRWLEGSTSQINNGWGFVKAPGDNGKENRDLQWVVARYDP